MFVLFWYVWQEETHSYTMVPNKHTTGVHFSSSQGKIAWLDEGKSWLSRKWARKGMNWNILDASFTPASSYSRQSLFYHTEWNDNCTFYAWEGSFWVPTHIFIQHLVFMAVFDWILGWCQFTPPGVPIHPSCANSPRPVVNFIFFNKTKTEVPEVLKIYMCRAFMHSSHAYLLQPSSC